VRHFSIRGAVRRESFAFQVSPVRPRASFHLVTTGEVSDPARLRDIASRALCRVELKLADYARTRDRLRALLERDLDGADHGALLHALCNDDPVPAVVPDTAVRGRSSRRLRRA